MLGTTVEAIYIYTLCSSSEAALADQPSPCRACWGAHSLHGSMQLDSAGVIMTGNACVNERHVESRL